nr:precorrin-6A/cobalt-precorrin-6A reductase [uncultured Cohaesibacter sp.]
MTTQRHILLLGGTAEARELLETLIKSTEHDITYSLAGVLGSKAEEVLRSRMGFDTDHFQFRMGGFGGPKGLHAYMQDHGIDLLIDATHPYATVISRNAVEASKSGGVPLARFVRHEWTETGEDEWTVVKTLCDAAAALPSGVTAFLSVGRQSIAPFASRKDCKFVIRSIAEAEEQMFHSATFIQGMPGRSMEEEMALFQDYDVDYLVTKNSGAGKASHKILAARKLHIPVIMVERPNLPESPEFSELEPILDWIENAPDLSHSGSTPSESDPE